MYMCVGSRHELLHYMYFCACPQIPLFKITCVYVVVYQKRTSLCACVLMVSLSYLLQLWQAGRQSTQKFVNMYGHIDVLRPYFDSDPHEIRKR